MDFIASTIGISTAQAWALVGAAAIAIGIGCMLKYAGRFLAIGALAIIAVAFLHEHASWNTSAQASQAQAPQEALNPQIVELPPASNGEPASEPVATQPVTNPPAISSEERAFLSACLANGDGDSQDDCINLYAEKQYVSGEDAAEPASAPAAKDIHAEYVSSCTGRGVPVYTCEVYFKREHYND